MRRKYSLLAYLLLNVLLSTAVTLGLLAWHDKRTSAAPADPAALCPPSAPAAAETAAPAPQFEIVAVVGAGLPESEYVILHYLGAEPVDMDGWTLSDEDGLVYTFPSLMLYPDGRVEVHTASGENSPVALFWGRETAVWRAGETASLFDPQGVLQARYQIP